MSAAANSGCSCYFEHRLSFGPDRDSDRDSERDSDGDGGCRSTTPLNP